MWAFHQTHHSSEDYNFTTALRQSVLQIYTSWVGLIAINKTTNWVWEETEEKITENITLCIL